MPPEEHGCTTLVALSLTGVEKDRAPGYSICFIHDSRFTIQLTSFGLVPTGPLEGIKNPPYGAGFRFGS